jgi:hypothetical protein
MPPTSPRPLRLVVSGRSPSKMSAAPDCKMPNRTVQRSEGPRRDISPLPSPPLFSRPSTAVRLDFTPHPSFFRGGPKYHFRGSPPDHNCRRRRRARCPLFCQSLMARPRWIDDPAVFSPWQSKYLRRLRYSGVLTFSAQGPAVPRSLRRLAQDGYVRISKKRPRTGPSWWEVRLTAAGQKIFHR